MLFSDGGVYIAGKMRGDQDCGFPKFFEAESWLLANTDFQPIFNPARRDVEATGIEFRGVTEFDGEFDLDTAMQADLDFIRSDDCKYIIVLEGFAGSEGTLAEMQLADELGKMIYHLRKTPWGFTLWPWANDHDDAWCEDELL